MTCDICDPKFVFMQAMKGDFQSSFGWRMNAENCSWALGDPGSTSIYPFFKGGKTGETIGEWISVGCIRNQYRL